MMRLLQELNEAVRYDDAVAVKALEEKCFYDAGYDCDWCKEWSASWAWDVSNYICTGAEDQLQISFHLWMGEDKRCDLSSQKF